MKLNQCLAVGLIGFYCAVAGAAGWSEDDRSYATPQARLAFHQLLEKINYSPSQLCATEDDLSLQEHFNVLCKTCEGKDESSLNPIPSLEQQFDEACAEVDSSFAKGKVPLLPQPTIDIETTALISLMQRHQDAFNELVESFENSPSMEEIERQLQKNEARDKEVLEWMNDYVSYSQLKPSLAVEAMLLLPGDDQHANGGKVKASKQSPTTRFNPY